MTETATEGTGTDTGTGTDGGTGTPDYEALYKAAAADVDKWKSLSRKHEKQAKDNADAGQTAAQRQAALDKVLAALGVEAAGSKTPDVDAITAQLQQAQASARAREVELAVLRVAGRSGADGDALLDSRSFLDSLNGVDPTDAAAITEAVKAAVTANPRYARGADTAGHGANDTTTTPPARQASSTGDFNGAPGGQRQWTEADVQRATPAELRKATKDGLLKQYLGS
ncbi:MAG: minor structural protein [Catenulispora phage 69_17]|jgi:hypothetical protein|nr:MAG: minor structural protein [Catenulispora phage 69_17]